MRDAGCLSRHESSLKLESLGGLGGEFVSPSACMSVVYNPMYRRVKSHTCSQLHSGTASALAQHACTPARTDPSRQALGPGIWQRVPAWRNWALWR